MNKIDIQQKINELPANIKRAVDQFDWATEILHIAHDHQLQIDTIETFRQETLLVIVGLTPAVDFEKNLIKNLGVSHELAEILVADANEHIFRPLQKIAFTRDEEPEIIEQGNNNDLESEIIEHAELSNVMSEHGVELVEEFEPEKPKNELQDLADGIFGDSEDDSISQEKEELEENSKIEDTSSHSKMNKPVEYNELIDEKDLKGIHGHRVDTSILKQSQPESILQNKKQIQNHNIQESSLDSSNFKNMKISKTELFDVSPTKTEQITENGDFLKHIGAE